MTIPLGNSQRSRLKLQVQSLIFLSWVFVHWKSIFSILTFEQFGVNSICKSASTPRLKSKTIALQYLGQMSSKLAPKTFRSKACFSEFFPPSLVLAVFLISGFYLTIWPLKLSEQHEPGNHIKNQRLKPLRNSMNVSRTKFDALHFPNASNSHLLAAISHACAARETTMTNLLIYTCYEF